MRDVVGAADGAGAGAATWPDAAALVRGRSGSGTPGHFAAVAVLAVEVLTGGSLQG
ncbi:hypothetical protein VITFI_CDS3251 [Vitreoscilla filiformis]|uniref:Uncharacterized protein n=1 Tax=Vitreoscilla filiformis TaxID=63 RepID=A0A221KIZ9_VITFI|nr:hypothetical protein VITFI_CDS3251 [Vitreoscilla filiformis]